MVIVVGDLDRNVSSKIRKAMVQELSYRLKTLPMHSEVDKIKSVVSGEFKTQLDNIVTEHYSCFAAGDIECGLTADDYADIYLERA